MDRRPAEPLCVTPLAFLQQVRLIAKFRQPPLQKVRRDMQEYPLSELFDGGEPFDIARQIGAVDREQYLVEFAFRRGGGRLQAREAVETSNLAEAMHFDDALKQMVPARGERQPRTIEGFGIEKRARSVIANHRLAGGKEIELSDA